MVIFSPFFASLGIISATGAAPSLPAAEPLKLAQASPPPARPAPGPTTRTDLMKNIDDRFRALDTNRDGKLSKSEIEAQQKRMSETREAQIRSRAQAQFQALDTNKDGQLSLQEYMAAIERRPRGAMNGDRALERLDANKDGTVTLEEYRAPAVANFDRLDTNKDGIITPEERSARPGRR